MTSGPIVLRTSGPEETRSVAAAIADLAAEGDLLVLSGDMGSGKTAFAQGFGAGLGVTEPITSPTFTIVREYEGRLALHHIDAYRLEHMQEVAELGVAEMLDEAAVMLVEWGDAIRPALPADHLEVHLEFGHDDDERELRITGFGGRWRARSRFLRQRLAPWTVAAGNGAAVPVEGDGDPC